MRSNVAPITLTVLTLIADPDSDKHMYYCWSNPISQTCAGRREVWSRMTSLYTPCHHLSGLQLAAWCASSAPITSCKKNIQLGRSSCITKTHNSMFSSRTYPWICRHFRGCHALISSHSSHDNEAGSVRANQRRRISVQDLSIYVKIYNIYRLFVAFFLQALVSSFWRRVSHTPCISVTEGQQKVSWDQTPLSLQIRSRPLDSQHKTQISAWGSKCFCWTGVFSVYLQPLTPWVRRLSSFNDYNLDKLMTPLMHTI